MKYYVVALFDDESYKALGPLQRNLSKKFKANRNSPIPYIPLEIIENPNIDKLSIVINKIIKPFKNFKVGISNRVAIIDSNKTLNLKIDDSGYIKRLDRVFSDVLKLHGFNIISKNTDMLLTLANMNYMINDNKKSNFDIDQKFKLVTLKVNRIELWKISNNRRETLIQRYPLKNF